MKQFLKRFSSLDYLVMVLIIMAGIILRWYLLDDRALHHDESLHGMYGKYAWLNPAQKFYKYNPLLHGPFMYNFLPWVYDLLGISKFSIRAVSAFFGSILIITPFFFHKYLRKTSLFILVGYISLSPTLIYWSRYIRHDCFVIFFMTLMLFGFAIKSKYKLLIVLPALTLQFCTKENSYITLSILMGFLLYESFLNKTNSCILRIWHYLKAHKVPLLLSCGISIVIYVYFFSSGFKHSQGIIDGLYRKSLVYWFDQHSIERIKGPFSFQLFILAWYEILFVAAAVVHMVHFYLKSNWKYRAPILFAIMCAITCHLVFHGKLLTDNSFWSFFKLKIGIDFYPLFIIPTHAILLTTYYIRHKNTKLSFWGYFFFATFFSYSFVGEKVPWLAQYPMLAGLIFLALYFQHYSFLGALKNKRNIILGTSLALLSFFFLAKQAIRTNVTNRNYNHEILHQVHTTSEYEELMYDIKKELTNNNKRFFCYNIAVWPTTWYMYGVRGYYYGAKTDSPEKFDFLIGKRSDYDLMLQLKDTHKLRGIGFRSWWTPQYKKMTWRKFLRYSFFRIPWNQPRTMKLTLYVKSITSSKDQ